MPNANSSFNVVQLIPACIVSVSLLASALIVANRPAMSAADVASANAPAKLLNTPPITQESVSAQLRQQLLAAPEVREYRLKGKVHRLQDIKVQRIVYSAKDDAFTVVHQWRWQPPLKDDWNETISTYSNDGYGHYYGLVVLTPILNSTGQNTNVTLK